MLAAATTLAAGLGVITSQGAAAAPAGGPASPSVQEVTPWSAQGIGEPAAAQDSAISAVAATSFTATGAQVAVWASPPGAATWRQSGVIMPAGFSSSYDPAAAAAPGGPLLVVAGVAPAGGNCITGGSVAIANVYSSGRLGPARLVSDQRGTGSFDDRPMVAVGQDGTVWVAWSQGPVADACQNVGAGDRIEVTASHDGGRTFGAPVTMPADGGNSAFGVRLVPLPDGQVAASWTEKTPSGRQAVLVSVLDADAHPSQPTVVLAGQGLPMILPGASFYDFPAGDIAALPGGNLMVAAPFWVSGQSVIEFAVGTPGGQWQRTSISPPAGADLLLPALGLLPSGGVRLVCAVHTRQGDHLGYDWADVTGVAQGSGASPSGLTALTPAPAGPGFFEIGEEMALAPTPDGLLTAMVVGGQHAAMLETATFSAPPAATASPSATPTPTPSPTTRSPRTTGATGTTGTTGTPAAGSSSGQPPMSAAMVAALAVAAALACAAIAAGVLMLQRRRGYSPVRDRR